MTPPSAPLSLPILSGHLKHWPCLALAVPEAPSHSKPGALQQGPARAWLIVSDFVLSGREPMVAGLAGWQAA